MNNYQRPHSPFEDSAKERLRRMGLATEDGSPERDAILKTIGYQAPHNVSCPACYEKYMAENLGGVDSYAE